MPIRHRQVPTHPRHKDQRRVRDKSLKIGDVIIKLSDALKYLGVYVDRKLRWKEQVEKAVAKGTEATLAIARLARSTFGLLDRYVRQLFVSIVVPRMEYALVYEPVRESDSGRRRGSVSVAKRPGRVQRLPVAACLITGAFKITAYHTLNCHACLPPIILRFTRSVHYAIVRLAALCNSHPLHKMVHRCASNYPRLHRSPFA